jgi:outer membrane protein TolC
MTFKWISITLVIFMMMLAMHGCVSPGSVDVDDVYRLQQAIRSRSPQDRGEEGLAPLRPGGDRLPALTITPSEDGKNRLVPISLQDVVMRTLANNTDIAVVSYTPAIRREQMIQAAAAFDYVLFGSIGYDHTDSPLNTRLRRAGNTTVAGTSTSRTLEWGIRQRTVTGANWSLTNTFLRSWDNATTDSTNRWYRPSLALQVTQPLLRDAWPMVNLAALRIARLDHEASMQEFREQVEQTVVEAMTAYYALIRAREDVRIAEQLLAATETTWKKIEQRKEIDAGKISRKQAESAVYSRQAVLLQARKIARDVQDRLVRLLGNSHVNLLQDDVVLVPTTRLPETLVEIDMEDQLLTALRLNPQLERLRIAIQQSEINLRVAKWQTLPSLNLTAGATMAGASRQGRSEAGNEFWSGDYISYSALLELEYPIGNREREAQLAEARLSRLQAVSQLQSISDQVALQVRERIRQIYERHAEMLVQRKAAAASRAELAALEEKEETIRLTPEFLNLKLNAQASVARTEQAVIQARTDYATAILDLQQATGAVLESQRVQLAMPVVAEPADLPQPIPAD